MCYFLIHENTWWTKSRFTEKKTLLISPIVCSNELICFTINDEVFIVNIHRKNLGKYYLDVLLLVCMKICVVGKL